MSIASPAIRKIAVEAYLSGKATQQHLADILGFHRTAIVRWVREYRKDGKIESQVRGHMPKAFSPEERERLVALIENQPDLTHVNRHSIVTHHVHVKRTHPGVSV
jgi:Transposase and inactivated derivatives